MPFTFHKTNLGPIVITPKVFHDERGSFRESFKFSVFHEQGIPNFAQDNHSISKKSVLRGLHYQIDPKAQGKLVRVTRGKAFDVAVDIRKESPNYGKHFTIELSEENQQMLYIPPGFAHGFQALEDNTHFLYKCTEEYSPDHERTIQWNDPTINIQWPLDPIVEKKDQDQPSLEDSK